MTLFEARPEGACELDSAGPLAAPSAGSVRPRTKVLFGSDSDRWRDDFAQLDLRPGLRSLLLKDDALRVLGLE